MATTTFNDLITFSRGSNATLVGPNGLVQWAPANLLTNSQDFEATAWSKVNVTATANAVVAPDGSTTADTVAATANGQAYIRQNATVIATATYTTSIYLRAGTVSWCLLEIWNSGVTKWSGRYINLSNGTLGGSTSGGGGLGGVFTVTNVGSGWYRVAVTAASDNTVLTPALYVADGDGDITVLAGNNINMWGAQLELGSTATTYNNTSVRNLLGFSEAFDNAGWTKTRASIVTGAQANPVNGLFNAQKLMEDTSTNSHSIIAGTALPANTPLCFSLYVKPDGRNVRVTAYTASNGLRATFNFSTLATTNGSYGNSTFTSATITALSGGWYRIALIGIASSNEANPTVAIELLNGTTLSYTGDGSSGVFIYGAQLSNSASLDAYVPTPGAAPSSTAYYGPRLDYDPVTLQPRGLLVEEARTNLLTYSEQFNDANWTKLNGLTVSANSTAAPDGTTTADTLIEPAATNIFGVRQAATLPAGSAAFSVFVKPNGRNWVQLICAAGGSGSAFFNVSTGVVGTTSGATATISPAANGFYRCTLVFTAVSGANTLDLRLASADGTTSYAGNGTSGVFVWGAQLEAGAFATSYIPTIASTVTRSADIASISGSLFSQWWNQPAGSFVADFDVIWSGNAPASMGVIGLDASASKRFAYISNGSQNASTFDGSVALGTANNIGSAANKVASAYDTSRYIALNGGAVATGTLAAGYSSGTSLDIGKYGASNPLNGHIRSIRYYPVRAADFQLQALTT